MRGLGLERPPGWGIALLVLFAIGNVALFALMFLRPAPADPYMPSTSLGGAATSAPVSTGDSSTASVGAAAPETAEPLVLAVYGDGYSAGNASGGLGEAGWPALVAQRTGMRLTLNAVAQAGYASIGSTGSSLRDVVLANPVPDADVTVIFGSRNDADKDAAQVRASAAEAIAAIRSAAPKSSIVVIGPAWDDDAPPASVLAARDAVQAAAAEGGVTFIDPIAAGWFNDPAGLIAADGVSPTDDGHAYLAELIAPAVQAAAEEAGQL